MDRAHVMKVSVPGIDGCVSVIMPLQQDIDLPRGVWVSVTVFVGQLGSGLWINAGFQVFNKYTFGAFFVLGLFSHMVKVQKKDKAKMCSSFSNQHKHTSITY